MKTKLTLLNLLVALSLTLAMVSLPIQAQTSADPQSGSVPKPAEKDEITRDQLPLDIQAKIDPRIQKELSGEIIPAHLGGQLDKAEVAPQPRKPIDKTRFLVYLKARTDLKAATARPFATLAQQRSAVANALINTAQATQGPVKSLLDTRVTAGSVASYQSFYIFNGFAVEGNWDTVVELAQRDDVERIAANYPLIKYDQPTKSSASPANKVRGLDPDNWNIDLVDADRVWNELGVNGAGAVVGDFDTGVQWDHPALKSQYRGWNGVSVNHNYNWFEPDSTLYPGGNLGASVSTVPNWCDDHGVHTMGTMVGDGGTADTQIGMAPGAKWIAVPGICGNTMPGDWGDDIGGNKAFQWFLCPTDLTGSLASRDCSKAPDVVNNSWGSSNPADDTFRPAIQALRAAGIMPVFAAGNPEAGPGSIGSPGSAPEAFTVGATDSDDQVASFSGRGPSFYEGVQKPNVTAPGVDIKSSIGGDGYQEGWSGTSMAAPAVSGLVALMVSADLKDGTRDFNVDEIQKFIESTAVKLGATTPNDNYGYGRIDAYNAVRWALAAGDLKGTITDAATSASIDGATIDGAKAPDTFTSRSAANGTYSVTVPGGLYNVTVSAFGYNPGVFSGVSVVTGTNSIVNFSLTPLPTAALTGAVLSGTTPISGAVVSVDAKPSVSFTTGASGIYTLTLPVGTHALTVKAKGHRIQHEAVAVASGGAAHNFALTSAPTILLVEADDYLGWFGARPAHNFFQLSLDQRNYLYDTTAITDSASFARLTTVMTPTNYGVVIWIHTGYSPGYGGYTTLLQNYLNAGGRLIISGEDIGYWDSGTSFYRNYLHATYSMDSAAKINDKVSGLGFLNGLNLTLNEAAQYSYANTTLGLYPDAVAPRDGNAYPVMTYDNGNGAAVLAVDPCGASYRAVYFAVGYENLGPRAYSRPPEYADVLDRSIQWVIGSKPAYGVDASIVPGSGIGQPGSVFTYNLTIANTGVNTDTYNLALGNVWPTRIVSGTSPVTQTVRLAACSRQVVGVEVTIPGTANTGASDTFTVTAASQASPSVNSRASAKTTAFPAWQIETPMPTPRYRLGATALPGTPYYFAIGGQGGSSWGDPMEANERYNACANSWDAMAPMPTALGDTGVAEIDGKIYVPGGYASGEYYDILQIYNTATDSWSEGASLPDTLWGAGVAASGGKLYTFGGNLLSGTTDRTFEYDPTSDTWTEKSPMPGGARSSMAAAALNGKIYIAGGWSNLNRVEVYDPATDTWSTAAPMNIGRQSSGLTASPDGYLYVSGGGNAWSGLTSAERYNPATDTWTTLSSLNDSHRAGSASAFVAGRVFAVGGSSGGPSNVNESLKLADAFCRSNKQVQQAVVQPGDRITYTLELRSNLTVLSNASVRDSIPAGTTFGSFGYNPLGAAYNSGQNRVEWSGAIPANQPLVTVTFGVVVNPTGWTNGQLITNTATFSDGVSLAFDSTATSALDFFDLTPSTKNVNKTAAMAGEVLTYTVHVENASTWNGAFTLTDPIPANVTYVPGSLTYMLGSGSYAGGVVAWAGQLPYTVTHTNTSGNYEWGDSLGDGAVPGVGYDWIEISNSGTPISFPSLDDNHYYPIALPFTFNFYGAGYTNLAVATNGTVYFQDSDLGLGNTPIPSSNGYGVNTYIAHFWDDLYVRPGSVYYEVQGSAPNRRMVIEYYHVSGYGSPDYGTWEVVLYENSGSILLQYQDVDFGTAYYDNGASATVGIQNTTSQGLQYSYNTPALSDGLAVLFLLSGSSYTGLADAADLTFAVTTTAPLTPNTWITNTATFTDSRNVVYRRSAGTLINSVDLSASHKIADRTEANVGDPVNYTVRLINSGMYTATGASLSDPIPANTTWNGIAPTCASGTCGYASGVITWTGNLTPGAPVTVSFGVTYTTPLMDRAPITNTATINDGIGGTFIRQAAFLARASNLSASYKTVSPAVAQPGEMVTYTVYLHNSGGVDGDAKLADPLPAGLTYVPGSLIFGSGSGSYAAGVITWAGSVPASSQIPVQFRATVDAVAVDGMIINTATITDVTWNTSYQRSAAFTQNQYTLTTNVVGSGVVTPSGTTTYTYGTVVTLTATPDAGWSFSAWSGDATGAVSPVTITLAGDKVVTATFASTCVSVSGVDFTYTPAAPKVGQLVTFNGTALTGTMPITYSWNYGDGSAVGSGSPITHLFPITLTTQSYTVTLTAANACGTVPVLKSLTIQPQTVFLPLVKK